MRRLLALFLPFAVSVALAATFQASLVHNAPAEQPLLPPIAAERIITLTSGETRVVCPTTSDRVSADTLELNPEQLGNLALALCKQ